MEIYYKNGTYFVPDQKGRSQTLVILFTCNEKKKNYIRDWCTLTVQHSFPFHTVHVRMLRWPLHWWLDHARPLADLAN